MTAEIFCFSFQALAAPYAGSPRRVGLVVARATTAGVRQIDMRSHATLAGGDTAGETTCSVQMILASAATIFLLLALFLLGHQLVLVLSEVNPRIGPGCLLRGIERPEIPAVAIHFD